MDNIDIVNSIEWHDGILLETKVVSKKSTSVTLHLELYKEQTAKLRSKIKIQFLEVESIYFSADATELADNYKAGNVSNGYIKPCNDSNKYKFFLYLSDGLISLNFGSLIIREEKKD